MDDNWERAKYELTYRRKQESYALYGSPEPSEPQIIEQKLKKEIELRAYLIYCATKNWTLDNWLAAEREFDKKTWEKEFASYREILIKCSHNKTAPDEADYLARIEFIRKRAYHIWENNWKEKFDWYKTEENLNIKKVILNKKKIVKRTYPYLSEQEALYCARDSAYKEIEEKASNRQKWISERAYYLAKIDTSRSPEDNWYIAEREWIKNG